MQISRTMRRIVLLSSIVTTLVAAPAHAAYQPFKTSVMHASTGRAAVFSFTSGIAPHIRWTKDGVIAPTFRAEVRHAWVADYTTTPNQCIFAKVEFARLTGTVSWPLSVTPSVSSTSDGWALSCRQPGQLHPRPILLHGVNLASKMLLSVTVRVCHRVDPSAAVVCAVDKSSKY